MPTILEFSEDRESPYAKNMFEFGLRINAGDAAAILYESPYDDRYTLWLTKTKRIPRKEQTDAMRSGIVTEPLIAAWYNERKGVSGASQAWGLHTEYDFLQAKADWYFAPKDLLAEFKAPSRPGTKDHESMKAGVVPRHYLLQCLHTLEVFDLPQMDLVSWRSADDFGLIEVKRDPEFFLEVMLPNYLEFWEALKTDKFPKPEGIDEQVSERRRMLARQWIDTKAMRAECETREARIKAELQRDQGTAKVLVGGGIRTSVVAVKGRFEVVISAENEAARDQIVKAVDPLLGKQGVAKITQRNYPPSLQFRVAAQDEQED